jgi:Protein of unknown function (DUF935)
MKTSDFFRNTIFGATADPRKRETGTSLVAKGELKPEGADKKSGSEVGSSRGGLVRDVVPQLGSRAQQINIYEEMSNSDAAVDVALRAAKMPVMGADYFIESFDANQENQDIAEFVKFNLIDGTSSPFLLILDDVLRMFEYGFSVLEQVYETREWAPKRLRANRKKYTMLKKLAARPTPTIKEIQYDNNGGPTGVVHNAIQADGKPKEVKIPIEKLIIFSNNKKGGNLEGKSLLRTAYRPWVFKSNLLNIDGIQKERHGMGFPVIKLPPGATSSDKDAAHELVRNIRTNEFGGAVLPFGFEFSFADITGQPVDVMRSIEHHDGQILLNTMTQFLLLGLEGTGGGRATSGAHQDMFNKSQRFVGNLICDYFNLYCIPQLVAFNFETDKFPKLRVRNIGETKDLQQWASALANLKAQQLINYTAETEEWVRSIIDAPLVPGTPEVKTTATTQKGDVTAQNDGNSGADPSNAEG